jgi:DNA topoisomerase I
VKQCRDIPGKELFQYYDHDGTHKAIDSGMVNDYLKAITGQDFTAKDFRTWVGTIQAINAFGEMDAADTKTQIKKDIIHVLDIVAEHLGNTRTVCKKYYVHPIVIELYERQALHDYLAKDDIIHTFEGAQRLKGEEKLLLHILEQEGLV